MFKDSFKHRKKYYTTLFISIYVLIFAICACFIAVNWQYVKLLFEPKKEEISITAEEFKDIVHGTSDKDYINVKNYDEKSWYTIDAPKESIVAEYDNSKDAIGYSYFYYVNTMYKKDTIKMVAVNGVNPTIDTIKNGEYAAAVYPLTAESNRTVDFLGVFTTDSEANVFSYSSEEYDRIYNEFKLAPTLEKATDCQTYLLKNAVVMPISGESTVFAMARDVNGVYFAGDNSNIYFYKGQKK